MAFDPPLASEIQPGDPITNALMTKIRDSLLFLNGAVGGNLANDIFNGNFEYDSDSDGVPDFWSKSDNHGETYPSGTVAFETTTPLSGAQSIKMVHPGGAANGGGLLESDYYECSPLELFFLGWLHYATARTMKNEVIVYWYDEDQVASGTPSTTLYSSVDNPTQQKYFMALCIPPADARYFTIGLVGGFTDTDVAGTAYFDSVSKFPFWQFRQITDDENIDAIAEDSTTSNSYVDMNSALVNIPFKGIPCTFLFAAQYKGDGVGGHTLYMRARIGSNYSNEVSKASGAGTYTSEDLTITIPQEVYGDQTLVLQGKLSIPTIRTLYTKMDANAPVSTQSGNITSS